MLFCLDDLDQQKHRDVINSYKFLIFLDKPGIRTRTIALHASPIHFAYIHTNSSKLLHVMICHFKALFEYAVWPAVFDGPVRYGTGTGQVRSR